MIRAKLVIGIVAVGVGVLLAFPALAAADSPTGYKHDAQGKLLGGMKGTYIGFDLKGKTKLKKIEILIPLRCEGESEVFPIYANTAGKSIRIKYPKRNGKVSKTGRFSARIKTKVETFPAKLSLKGTIKGKVLKGTAKLTIKSGSVSGNCSSGLADWSAKKGKRVNTPTPIAAERSER